jgi:alpha-tubulin suppressor-like RCC1 family protein
MAFCSLPNGDLQKVFITEYEIIDRFVGNQLWLWGDGSQGRLGNNATQGRSSPVQTVSTGTNWQQVSAGPAHTAAIKTDGTLWLWGDNNDYELGDYSTINRSSPVQTATTGTNWKQVSLGRSHTAATKTDGTLWLWGVGASGRLGNNSVNIESSPVQTVSSGTNWKNVSAGESYTAATKTDGTLWLWGRGTEGQLGTNSTINQSSPVQTVSSGTNWQQVSAGDSHSAAIKTDGTLWLWGSGVSGRLGTNSEISRSSPVQTVSTGTNWKQVCVAQFHSSAMKQDGTLWLWGCNNNGQLGNNSTIPLSSPVQTITTGTNWKQVSLSNGCHSAAIKTDGTLWIWGNNTFGNLGINSALTTSRSSPVQTVSLGTSWKEVSLGCLHSSAVTFTEL